MKELHEALQRAKKELAGKIVADQKNFYGQPVTSLNKAIEIILPIFWKHGLDINQYQAVFPPNHPVLVTEIFHLETGQSLLSHALLFPKGPGEQALGSAETYVKRRGYLTAAGVATDGDPDLDPERHSQTQYKPTSPEGSASNYKGIEVMGEGPEMILDKQIPVSNLPAKNGKMAGKFFNLTYRKASPIELVEYYKWLKKTFQKFNKWQEEFIRDVEMLQFAGYLSADN